MVNDILDFIHSFTMFGNGEQLMNGFNIEPSKIEISSKTEKSFMVENLTQAVDIVSSLHESITKEKVNTELTSKINIKQISELEPFWIVISVPNGELIL